MGLSKTKPNEAKNHRKSILPASTRLDPPKSTAFRGLTTRELIMSGLTSFFSEAPSLSDFSRFAMVFPMNFTP